MTALRAGPTQNGLQIGQSIGVWRRSQDRVRRPGERVALVAYGVAITEVLLPGLHPIVTSQIAVQLNHIIPGPLS